MGTAAGKSEAVISLCVTVRCAPVWQGQEEWPYKAVRNSSVIKIMRKGCIYMHIMRKGGSEVSERTGVSEKAEAELLMRVVELILTWGRNL